MAVRPIVVAHRALIDGGAGENTLDAIRAAAAAGADAVELDVRITADQHLLLAHDPVQWTRLGWLPWPQVVRWTARASLPGRCSLAEALEVADDGGAGRLAIKLDVKDPAALGPTATLCAESGIDLAKIALWCRSPVAIAELADRLMFAEVALLADSRDALGYSAKAVACGANAISLNPGALTANAVSIAHARGLIVYAWIRNPNRHREAVDLGVDGLVTDWVASARAAASAG